MKIIYQSMLSVGLYLFLSVSVSAQESRVSGAMKHEPLYQKQSSKTEGSPEVKFVPNPLLTPKEERKARIAEISGDEAVQALPVTMDSPKGLEVLPNQSTTNEEKQPLKTELDLKVTAVKEESGVSSTKTEMKRTKTLERVNPGTEVGNIVVKALDNIEPTKKETKQDFLKEYAAKLQAEMNQNKANPNYDMKAKEAELRDIQNAIED